MKSDQAVALVLAALAASLLLTAVLGSLAERCRQPAVVGQMLAGVLLGPIALGSLPGHPLLHLFTAPARTVLGGMAQLGLACYVFGVARDFDLGSARRHGKASGAVAAAGLLVPLGVGAGTGWLLARLDLAGGRHLTIAVAITFAVTAMPVLARIVEDFGLTGTRPGIVGLTAAAVQDTIVWGLLVVVVVTVGTGSGPVLWVRLAGLAGLVGLAVLVLRPLLRRLFEAAAAPHARAAIVLALVLGCSAATTAVGLHAVFGALLCGVLAPRPRASQVHAPHLDNVDVGATVTTVGQLLLPTFFVTTGLAMAAPHGSALRALALVAVLAVLATASKVVPVAGTALRVGLGRRDSWTVGLLMNTRGLTELIVLSILAGAGLIGADTETVLIGVTLVATVATPWLFALPCFAGRAVRRSAPRAPVAMLPGAARPSPEYEPPDERAAAA